MKVLVLTGIYPEPQNPSSDIFITRRLFQLQEFEIAFEAFVPIQVERMDLKLWTRL